MQRGESITYLGNKIGWQKIRKQKAQIRRDQFWTLKDFQRLLGDLSNLWTALIPDLIIHLNKILNGDKDLHSPRELTTESWKN